MGVKLHCELGSGQATFKLQPQEQMRWPSGCPSSLLQCCRDPGRAEWHGEHCHLWETRELERIKSTCSSLILCSLPEFLSKGWSLCTCPGEITSNWHRAAGKPHVKSTGHTGQEAVRQDIPVNHLRKLQKSWAFGVWRKRSRRKRPLWPTVYRSKITVKC